MLGNWVGFAVQLLLAFFMTPFVLRSLGDTRYGLWAIIVGLTGYYGLLDVGFRAGLTQHMARALGTRSFDQLNRIASTGFVALSVCTFVVCAASIVVSAAVDKVFTVPPEMLSEVRWAILIIGVGTASQFAFFPFSAAINAAQRNEVASAIGVATRLLQAAATWYAISRGGGLTALASIVSSCNLVDYILRWQASMRLIPEMSISFRLANWKTCWEFTSFGLWNVLICGSQQLILCTDAIVLGLFVPAAAIARFALAGNLNNQFGAAVRPLAMAYYPAMAQMDARGEQSSLSSVYFAGSRLMVLVTLSSVVVAVVWSRDFFRLWVGESYLVSTETSSVTSIFYLLLAANALHGMQRVGVQYLMATQQQRVCAVMFLAEGVLNLVVSLTLIPAYGLIGSAIGTLIPAIVFQGVVLPLRVHSQLRIGIQEYVQSVLVRATIMAGLQFVVVLGFSQILIVDGWVSFFLAVSASTAVCLGLAMSIGMRTEERQRFVFGPISRWCFRIGIGRRKSELNGETEPIRVSQSP